METMTAERDSKGRLKKGSVLNPRGKVPGTKNKFTKDIAEVVTEALQLAGKRVQKKERSFKDMEPAVAYMVDKAINRPELFIPLIRQMMPAKIDAQLTIMSSELTDLLAQRRKQLADMRDVTPDD